MWGGGVLLFIRPLPAEPYVRTIPTQPPVPGKGGGRRGNSVEWPIHPPLSACCSPVFHSHAWQTISSHEHGMSLACSCLDTAAMHLKRSRLLRDAPAQQSNVTHHAQRPVRWAERAAPERPQWEAAATPAFKTCTPASGGCSDPLPLSTWHWLPRGGPVMTPFP